MTMLRPANKAAQTRSKEVCEAVASDLRVAVHAFEQAAREYSAGRVGEAVGMLAVADDSIRHIYGTTVMQQLLRERAK